MFLVAIIVVIAVILTFVVFRDDPKD